jgi:hypothetical protein
MVKFGIVLYMLLGIHSEVVFVEVYLKSIVVG